MITQRKQMLKFDKKSRSEMAKVRGVIKCKKKFVKKRKKAVNKKRKKILKT
jgi:hypothetical protein